MNVVASAGGGPTQGVAEFANNADDTGVRINNTAAGDKFSLSWPGAHVAPKTEDQRPPFILHPSSCYCLDAASATDFICARPFSKSPPTILSIFMNRAKAFPMKVLSPDIVHVTPVWSP